MVCLVLGYLCEYPRGDADPWWPVVIHTVETQGTGCCGTHVPIGSRPWQYESELEEGLIPLGFSRGPLYFEESPCWILRRLDFPTAERGCQSPHSLAGEPRSEECCQWTGGTP